MTNKRIISLLLALMLIISSVFSLSSCFQLLDFYFSSEEDSENGEGGGNSGGNSENGGGSGSSGVTGGESDSEVPEFYPGRGENDIEIEAISSASRALLSCVSVHTTFEISYGYPSYSTDSVTARGSGVIYKLDRAAGDAYIITNYHVVYDPDASTTGGISEDIDVFLYGQESESYAIPAKYVGGSMAYDLAVLKISGSEVIKNSYALAATVADSDEVTVFDTVAAIGNPEGEGISVTTGIVSVDSEQLQMTGADGKTWITLRVIRVSAAINEGNSGGGLFDTEGNLIGIVNAKKTGSEIDNIGYAIPTNIAIRLADNIIFYCNGTTERSAKKCMLGVTLEAKVMGVVVDPETEKITKAEVVEVASLTESCIISDKIAIADRINSITVDGVTKAVTRVHHVVDFMLLARVGSVVTLNVTRGSETFDITVTITEAAITNV